MANRSRSNADELNAHNALTCAKLDKWPVHELKEHKRHNRLHILSTVVRYSGILTQGVENFVDEWDREEKDNKHDRV